jgi:hypothetical protein
MHKRKIAEAEAEAEVWELGVLVLDRRDYRHWWGR